MARAKNPGNERLEEAMATLLQTQAYSVQIEAVLLAKMAKLEKANAEAFARIEAILLDHSRILAEHSRMLADLGWMLQSLPDAMRQELGQIPEKPASAE